MPSAANVNAASPKTTGIVFFAATGTTLPTDATTTLAAAFKDCGYISEDGISYDNTRDVTEIKEMGGSVVLTIQTSKTDTFKFTMLESLNENALKVIFGDSNVAVASDVYTIKSKADQPARRIWAIDMILSDGRSCRHVIPDGQVSAVDTITYSGSDAIKYGVTINCAPDSTGVSVYTYIGAAPA